MTFKRLVVVDPGMYKESGHHLAYNQALQTACAQIGMPAYFLFNALTPPEILASFSSSKAFFALSTSFYEDLSSLTPAERLVRVQFRAEEFVKNLSLAQHAEILPGFSACAAQFLDAQTLLLAHSGNEALALGLAIWFAGLPQEQKPQLALNFFHYDESPQFGKIMKIVGAAFKGDSRVRIFAGFESIGQRLSKTMGLDVGVFPAPLPPELSAELVPEADFSVSQLVSAPPVFGMVGELRPGKNFEIIPPAVLRYLRGGGTGSFVFHVNPMDVRLTDALVLMDDISDLFPRRVSLKLGHLQSGDYYAALRSFSVLLLPYNQRGQSNFFASGLMQEALSLGLPMIFCRGGAIEEEWQLAAKQKQNQKAENPLSLEQPTPDNLFAALRNFELNFSKYKAMSGQMAVPYRAFHNRDNLLKVLLQDQDAVLTQTGYSNAE